MIGAFEIGADEIAGPGLAVAANVNATLQAFESGDDVFLARVVVSTSQVVQITLAVLEQPDDALVVRITAGPGGVADGGYLYTVPPEWRLWPVL